MKKKNFFMLALAAVAFAACSNEDLVPTGNPGDDNQLVTDPTGDAWVALAVKTPVQTRGLHNPNQEAATEDESKITTVRAIFFTANANEDAATVTADLTLDNDEAGLDANGIPSGAAGKAFKVPATSKRILIIANPSPKFEAKTASETDQKWPVGTTYATVNAALDDTSSDYDYNWTDVLMNRVGHRMQGLSLHYYTVTGWSGSKGAATKFNKDDFYWTMGKCLEVEDVIKKHCAIMDKYDKDKKIALLLDEWGTWWDEEPGTVRGHLYQQNTLRDAFVASLSLDVFHKYTDRLKMANIAQIVNVLQSMILTKDKDMVLTPTYYVFKMYKVHQDATYLPLDLTCEKMNVRDNRTVPMVSATASKNKNGVIHISLSNVDADNAQEITVNLPDVNAKKAIGEILTSANLTDYNSFEKPNIVKPASFKEVKINKGIMKVKLPAKSIVTLELQ